ncbi:MAG: hypothetical protein LBP25_06760 [Tannerellaceae bacterium]|nr:hypothetical protein [Tannerellaceae bacterium]
MCKKKTLSIFPFAVFLTFIDWITSTSPQAGEPLIPHRLPFLQPGERNGRRPLLHLLHAIQPVQCGTDLHHASQAKLYEIRRYARYAIPSRHIHTATH